MAINSVQTASVRVNVISGTLGVGRVLSVSSAIPAGASLQWQVNGVNVANSGVALPAGESLLSLRATTTTDPWTFNFEVGNGVGGTTTGDVELWEPQFETGSTRTNFQRVGLTAFDVTEAGQRDCYGVRADGTDDFYTTASTDFTGTNKITVFAALRKRSDAARGIFFEHTALAGNNSGGFNINAPTASLNDYGFFTSSTSGNFVTAVSSTNPAVAVLTGQGSILDDSLTIRLNGSQVGSNILDQGSGTYANAIMHLFRRGGTDLPFNGDLYALIVAGASYPLSTIQRVERILSRITPTVNL
jgi:hypothetical protein